jgi:DNA-binding NarL/FixJ family response regulator
MNPKEPGSNIAHHLSLASRSDTLFSDDAIQLIHQLGRDERPTTVIVPGLVTALSDRELEVPHLLAAGKQNQDIADELHMALNTVKKHATHIFDKLGATNRSEATVRAREPGQQVLSPRRFGLLS